MILRCLCAGGSGLWLLQLFQGYSPVTFLVVANLALSGLLVSWIMKYADSIMKVGSTLPCLLVSLAPSLSLSLPLFIHPVRDLLPALMIVPERFCRACTFAYVVALARVC